MSYITVKENFEDIFNEYSDMITRICILNLRHTQDAKDCFQNVFIKLFQTDVSFESKEHLKAWLIKVTFNECHSYQRKFYRWTVNIDEVLVQDDKEQLWLLPEVLRLPKKQRNVLYLYYYEGYKIQEIAVLLHMKENTVKSHLKRGKERLRERIGEFYE